jgi:hypothetical protein
MSYFKFLLKNIDKLLAGLAQQEKRSPQRPLSSTQAPVCLIRAQPSRFSNTFKNSILG